MNSVSGAVRARRDKQSIGYADVAAPAVPAPIVAADAGAACVFEIVSSREAFDALAGEWNELFARAGRGAQAFQAFDWNRHWCNHYLRPRKRQRRRLAILTGRREGRLVMVWPLVTSRVAGLLQLSWMGDPVSQYGDILAEESADALELQHAAWAHLLAAIKPDLVWLPRVREDATIAPLVAELGALVTQRRAAPYARREDAENAVPSRNRRRNAAKSFAKLGDVRFVEETGNAAASATGAIAIGWKRGQLLERGILARPSPIHALRRSSPTCSPIRRWRRHVAASRSNAMARRPPPAFSSPARITSPGTWPPSIPPSRRRASACSCSKAP